MLAALWGEPEVYRHAVVKHSACRLTDYLYSVQQIEFKLHYRRRLCTCGFLIYPDVSLAIKPVSLSSQMLLSIHQNIFAYYKYQ